MGDGPAVSYGKESENREALVASLGVSSRDHLMNKRK